jgi:hypothetical protein
MVKLGRIFGVIQDNSLVMVIEQLAKPSVARGLCRRYLYLTELLRGLHWRCLFRLTAKD